MATPADGEKEGPGEAVAPVVADPGPSGEAGNPGAGVWSGKHPTIKAATEDAAHYHGLLPKYKESFKDRELLTHPEEWRIMRRVVTMVVHDTTQGRLISLDKDILASALNSCGIKPSIIHKSDYANFDLLLESEDKAREAASKVHISKNLRLEPMYMGRRHTSLTVFNVPIDISRDRLGAFFSQFGDVESVTAVRLKSGVFSANYKIRMKTTTDAFENVPDYLICRGRQITVVVDGRKGHCFFCRQQGHLARDCPLKRQQQQQQQQKRTYAKATSPTAPAAPAPATAAAPASPAPASAPPAPAAPAQPQKADTHEGPATEEEGWTTVTGNSRKSRKSYTPPTSPAKPRPVAAMEVDPKAQKRRAVASDEETAPKSTAEPKKKKAQKTTKQVIAATSKETTQKKEPKSRSSPAPDSSPEPRKSRADKYVSSATPKPSVQDLPNPKISIPSPSSTPSTPNSASLPATVEALTVEAQNTPTTSTPQHVAATPNIDINTPETPSLTQPRDYPKSPRKSRDHNDSRSKSTAPSRSRSSGRRKPYKEGVDCLQVGEEIFENLSDPMRKILHSLKKRRTFNKKNCEDPRNFPNARLVMTLIKTTERVRAWDLIEHSKKAFPDIVMVDKGNEEDRIMRSVRNKIAGRLPIYVHPSLYRSLKLMYPSEIGVIVRDGHVPHDHGHGNLGLHAGQLCLEDFEPVCDKE